MRGERQAHLVPAVHEDVGVVVGGLGGLGDAVDERDRGGEVGEAASSRTIERSSPACQSADAGQALLDLGVAEQCSSVARLARSRCAAYSQGVRIVSLVPHATELLFALGLGPEVVGGHARVRLPARRAGAARVTRDVLPGGLSAGGDRRGGARAHAARRGDLRARPRRPRGARAGADRHAGAVPGVRGLLRGGRRGRAGRCRRRRA